MNPWDKTILEVDPKTGYAKWVFKWRNGILIPNHMDRYGCIDKLIIAAQRNKFIKSGYKDELSQIYIGGGYMIDLKRNI